MSAKRAVRIFYRITLVVLLVAICIGGFFGGRLAWRKLFPPSPLVMTPVLALQDLKAKSLYFNAAARPWLMQMRPDLIMVEDRNPDSKRSVALNQSVQDTKLFRQLDRQYRFDKILLLDDPSQFSRLLDHLLDTKDFKLVYLDHWAMVFERNAPTDWKPDDAKPLHAKLEKLRKSERAAAFAQVARRMLALHEYAPAKQWLDEAAQLDDDSVDVLCGLADYNLYLGKWNEALVHVDKALEEKPDYIPALAAKLQAMRATRYFVDAFKISQKLNTLLPENPVRLWQHAETAREAREYQAQIDALHRLIALADEEGRRVGLYEFYLGEAYAHAAMENGEYADDALKHLRNAVADPLLADDHRKFAEERIKTIRERMESP